MAGTGGYFLQGLGSGLQTGFEMGWNIKQKKKLEQQKTKLEESVNKLIMNNPDVFETGTATAEHIAKINAEALAMGTDVYEHITNYTNAITNNNAIEAEKESKWIDEFTNLIDNYGPMDIDSPIFDNFVKGEGRKYLDAYNQQAIKKEEAQKTQPQIERFASPADVTSAYPGATPKHTTQGWIPEFAGGKQPDLAGAITYMKKHNIANMSPEQFEQLKTGTGKYFNCEVELANHTKEWFMESEGGGTPDRVTSLPQLEKYRENIKNTDTWKDAQGLITDYTKAGYDATQLGVTKEAWLDVKKSDLDNLVSVLNEITAGTPESRNIKGNKEFTFNMNDEEITKTGAEWYSMVYDSYAALLKLLEEAGIDTSQYKKLKSLSEIKKIKFGGFVGEGVETGDLIKIYY